MSDEKKMYKLMDENGQEYLSPEKGALGGNGKGKIYGRMDCPSANATLRGKYREAYISHRVFFKDEATAIAAGFLDLPAELTTGRGSGINDERMKIKTEVVRKGLEVNKPIPGNGMDVLCKGGGYDHAGLAGMMLAGAARHVPTMVDGVNATAAALIAYGIDPGCAEYMLCSHLSSDISAKKMLEVLKLKPIVHAGMRLGEGTGASLAISILRSALDTYRKLTGE